MIKYSAFLIFFLSVVTFSQQGEVRFARLKYSGGGDWYNDPSADINLLKFVKANSTLKISPEYKFVDIASDDIFLYPFLFMTGHGNVYFNPSEAERLRSYLESGGFLYIDDDYGLDNAVRREMKKVFPEQEFVELPFTHKIYSIKYDFTSGVPKTHKHDEKPAAGFGLFVGERLVVYYTYESNPSDGWADATVHNNPEEKRQEALRFGTNILIFALTQ